MPLVHLEEPIGARIGGDQKELLGWNSLGNKNLVGFCLQERAKNNQKHIFTDDMLEECFKDMLVYRQSDCTDCP